MYPLFRFIISLKYRYYVLPGIVLSVILSVILTPEVRAQGIFQAGLDVPVYFGNDYTTVKYQGRTVKLIKKTFTDGASGLLGYRYLIISGDSISQRFTLNTDENEELIVRYQSVGIGMMLRFGIFHLIPGIGMGTGYMECTKVCGDTYKNPEKSDMMTGFTYFGFKLYKQLILNFGFKYFSADTFKTYADDSTVAPMTLSNTSIYYLSFGLMVDF